MGVGALSGLAECVMKIVFVIGTLGRGGAESQLVILMRALLARGFRVQLFVLENRGDLLETVNELGVINQSGDYDSTALRPVKILLLFRALFRLWKLLRRERPDVVQGVLPLSNIFAAVAGKLARVPCVITARRALNRHQDRILGWKFMDQLSARLSNVVVANAEAVKYDTLQREGGDPAKFQVIYNGIDISNFKVPERTRIEVRRELQLPKDAEVLLIVANLIPYKGHKELLHAVAYIQENHPKMYLLVAGEDRGIGEDLKKEAIRLGIDDRVRWLGLRRDVPRLLAAADVYISASHEEGFSNSLLEALAAGKAVVATSVGGNPEMLESGTLGLLVPPGDFRSLGEGIHRVLQDVATGKAPDDKVKKIVQEKYSIEKMVDEYVNMYKSCFQKRDLNVKF